MIAIIDYGIGNVSSISNMFKKIGVSAILTSDHNTISQADKIILPGVGSFDSGMTKLHESGLVEIIKEHTLINKKPLLGICLGMQMLGTGSEEGKETGLSFIPFTNKKFSFDEDVKFKVPHMGWNIVSPLMKDDPFLYGLEGVQRYYFVHSYHAVCESPENVLLECDYGYIFTAAVKKDNIYGVQFHPEKSHNFGMALLENFARRV